MYYILHAFAFYFLNSSRNGVKTLFILRLLAFCRRTVRGGRNFTVYALTITANLLDRPQPKVEISGQPITRDVRNVDLDLWILASFFAPNSKRWVHRIFWWWHFVQYFIVALIHYISGNIFRLLHWSYSKAEYLTFCSNSLYLPSLRASRPKGSACSSGELLIVATSDRNTFWIRSHRASWEIFAGSCVGPTRILNAVQGYVISHGPHGPPEDGWPLFYFEDLYIRKKAFGVSRLGGAKWGGEARSRIQASKKWWIVIYMIELYDFNTPLGQNK